MISPAVTNGPSPMGLSWLLSFLKECSDCHIDSLALHCALSRSTALTLAGYADAAYFRPYFTDAFAKRA